MVQELFSEIYDGVTQRQALLEKHLTKCPACAAEYEGYKQMLDDMRLLPEPELPQGFHDSVMAKIRAIAPPSDHAIDELLGEIETRTRRREARRKKPKAASTARRWAVIATAACLMLASLWAVRTFDLPGLRDASDYERALQYAAPDAEAMVPQADQEPAMRENNNAWIYGIYEDDAIEDSADHAFGGGDNIWGAPQAIEAADAEIADESEMQYQAPASFDMAYEDFEYDGSQLWDTLAEAISPEESEYPEMGRIGAPETACPTLPRETSNILAPAAYAGAPDDDMAFELALTGGTPLSGNISPWIIAAVAAGAASLCAALGAIFWIKAKKG